MIDIPLKLLIGSFRKDHEIHSRLEIAGYPSVFRPISRGGLLVLGSVESLFWMFFFVRICSGEQ